MSMAVLFDTHGDEAAGVLTSLRLTGRMPDAKPQRRSQPVAAEPRRVSGTEALAMFGPLMGMPIAPDAAVADA